jgi:hypothetical protein
MGDVADELVDACIGALEERGLVYVSPDGAQLINTLPHAVQVQIELALLDAPLSGPLV